MTSRMPGRDSMTGTYESALRRGQVVGIQQKKSAYDTAMTLRDSGVPIVPSAMERIAVVGVTIQDESVATLDQLRRPSDGELRPLLHDLADDLAASELVVLSTCNRCEVYYARESGDLPDRGDVAAIATHFGVGDSDEWSHRFRQRRGRAAARHLFRVAASLDSLVVGENQILAQIRGAVRSAEGAGLAGGLLAPVFEAALRAGKRVRLSTGLAQHSLSVVALGVGALCERLPEATERRVAVIGAGSTGRLAARTLAGRGLTPALIVNRSEPAASDLASEFGADAMSLEHFLAEPRPVDVLVSATGAAKPLMEASALRELATLAPRREDVDESGEAVKVSITATNFGGTHTVV